MIWLLVALWIVGLSLLLMILFWWDKRKAVKGGRRVSEATLLLLAVLGGWPGAKYAQRVYRHKTQKQPFGNTLNLCGLILGAALVGLAAWQNPDALQNFRSMIGVSAGDSDTISLPRRFGPGAGDD